MSRNIPAASGAGSRPLKGWTLTQLNGAREDCLVRFHEAVRFDAISDAKAIGHEMDDVDRELTIRRMLERLD